MEVIPHQEADPAEFVVPLLPETSKPTATDFSTKDIGWPDSNLKIFVDENGEYCFKTSELFEEFGIKRLVDKRGYKSIYKLLPDESKPPF